MHAQALEKKILNRKKILTKAIYNAAMELNLSRYELSKIIGPSESTFSRLFGTTRIKVKKISYLDPASKEGQLAALLLRLYKNLDVFFGGNSKNSQLWLRNENTHLEGKPIDLIKSPEGLVTVVQYLDAMRGKT